jgi:hypothetical protein
VYEAKGSGSREREVMSEHSTWMGLNIVGEESGGGGGVVVL